MSNDVQSNWEPHVATNADLKVIYLSLTQQGTKYRYTSSQVTTTVATFNTYLIATY